jgi:hypothetical protein
MAGLMVGLTRGTDTRKVLENACRLGAYVAWHHGATPLFSEEITGLCRKKYIHVVSDELRVGVALPAQRADAGNQQWQLRRILVMLYNPRRSESFISRFTYSSLVIVMFASMICVLGATAKTRRSAVTDKLPALVPTIPSVPVTAGTVGNEPIVAIAPDGTLYISALQHMYRSLNGGATWAPIVGPPEAQQLNLNSDSSISVDPGGRLYFTFDYPYAGTTAVCTSDDKGDTWSCNPAVVPGGTDRMWVVAPSTSTAYEVTNEGLYETAFLASTDRGTTWIPKAIGSGVLEPQSGPLLQRNCSKKVIQPIKVYGTSPSDVPELKVYVYDPDTTGAVLSDVRPTGLALPTALPAASFSQDGVLYVCSEEANAAGGRQVVVARSADEGTTWTKLPPIPATTTGTATFSWVAAGEPGHIGVLYYYTSDNGDPGTLTSNWSAVWAESFNGNTANPNWTVTTVENPVRTGPICVAADCMGSKRFAGDFINAIIDPTGAAHLTWMRHDGGESPVLVSIRYQRIQSGPVSTYVAPPCGGLPIPVELDTVVSSKVHGSTERKIDMPVTGPHGIECRDGGANGEHTLVFTFADTLTSVQSAAVSSGSGEVKDSAIDSNDSHQYVVNLKNVANEQHIFVTLHGVQGAAGHSSDAISAPMSLLLGDVNADGFVLSGDYTTVRQKSGSAADADNFRCDVNYDGTILSGDYTTVRQQSGTKLP